MNWLVAPVRKQDGRATISESDVSLSGNKKVFFNGRQVAVDKELLLIVHCCKRGRWANVYKYLLEWWDVDLLAANGGGSTTAGGFFIWCQGDFQLDNTNLVTECQQKIVPEETSVGLTHPVDT